MSTARQPIRGNNPESLKNFPTSKRANFQEPITPSTIEADDRNRASKWPGHNRSTVCGCSCVESEDLPRIVLVSGGDDLMAGLSRALDPCPLEILCAKDCRDAGLQIGRHSTAEIIFTDVRLPDGDWKEVLRMARQMPARAEVIVVSRLVDVPLYLDTLEAGAYDFVVPPFLTVELGYIIVNAIYACFKKRPHRLSGSFADAMAV